jgi:hypothetical protein
MVFAILTVKSDRKNAKGAPRLPFKSATCATEQMLCTYEAHAVLPSERNSPENYAFVKEMLTTLASNHRIQMGNARAATKQGLRSALRAESPQTEVDDHTVTSMCGFFKKERNSGAYMDPAPAARIFHFWH